MGAEIEQVVITALFEAFSEQRSIRLSDFEKAVKNMVPLPSPRRSKYGPSAIGQMYGQWRRRRGNTWSITTDSPTAPAYLGMTTSAGSAEAEKWIFKKSEDDDHGRLTGADSACPWGCRNRSDA